MGYRSFVPFFLAVAALAQPQANPKPASLEGKAVNSVTGAPGVAPPDAPKSQGKTYAATTNDTGAFRFELANVQPGLYTVMTMQMCSSTRFPRRSESEAAFE